MNQRTKYIGLVILLGTLISLILLAISLSNLQLQPGTPIPGGAGADRDAQTVEVLPAIKGSSFPILQGILGLIFLLTVIYILARIATLTDLKKVLQAAFVIGLLLVIVALLPSVSPGQPNSYSNELSEMPTPEVVHYQVTPLGEPPKALIWLVVFGIVVGVSLVAFRVLKEWLKQRRLEDELYREAQQAVVDINNGVDLRNVIVRCYVQMTRSLQEGQGIERRQNMTVSEFEDELERKGFPSSPVHQLTSLFEKVRYGEQVMHAQDETIAIQSLNEIILFCQNSRH